MAADGSTTILPAVLDDLIIKANGAATAKEVAENLQDLKARLLSSADNTTFCEVVPYTPWVQDANDNLGENPDAHDLAYVMSVCSVAGYLTGRTRKAYYLALALVYVFWRITNRYFLAEIIQKEIGEPFSDKRNLGQTIRLCFNLKSLPGTTEEVRRENKKRTNAVSRANAILLDVESHFKNAPLRLEDAGMIQAYLANRDRMAGKSDADVMTAILADPPHYDTSNDEDNTTDDEAPGDNGDEEQQDTDDGDDNTADDEAPDDDSDGGSDDSDDDRSEDGNGEDTGASSPDNTAETGRPMSKAQRMLAGVQERSPDDLLRPCLGSAPFVALCYRVEYGGRLAAVAATPCDEGMTAKFYEVVQAGGVSDGMIFFQDTLTALETLTVSARPASTSAPPAPARPAVVFTIGAGGVVQSIRASDPTTLGTAMLSITPTVETIIANVEPGQYVSVLDWRAVSAKVIRDAVAANDAQLRITGSGDGFTASIAVPRIPDIQIPFTSFKESGLRVAIPSDAAEFQSEFSLTPERLRNLRDGCVVPFLKASPAKLRNTPLLVCDAEEGICLEHGETKRCETFPAEVIADHGGAVPLLAEDFVRHIDNLARIVNHHSVSIYIGGEGVMGIRAFTDHCQIEAVIPGVAGDELLRSPVFAQWLEPEACAPAAPSADAQDASTGCDTTDAPAAAAQKRGRPKKSS